MSAITEPTQSDTTTSVPARTARERTDGPRAATTAGARTAAAPTAGTATAGSSKASGGTKSSGGSKWTVRDIDEADVTEKNLGKFLKGRYEDADKQVQELFLFVYCDCALNAMNKVPKTRAGEKINVKNYFDKFSAITCAMIKVVMLEDRKNREQADGASTDQTGGVAEGEENQGNNPVVDGVPPGTDKEKSKGGRPRGCVNFEKKMQEQWKIYTNIENIDRKDALKGKNNNGKNNNKMTWYKAAVTEMDRKTAPTTKVTRVETSSGEETKQGSEQARKDGKGNGSIDLTSMAFLEDINIEEV